MAENSRRAQRGQEKGLLLRSGLWRFSRHPNYFGEQLFWWSIALFSIPRGDWWAASGTLFNSLILVSVTLMTENRMLSRWPLERAERYREYQRTTSPWVPMP